MPEITTHHMACVKIKERQRNGLKFFFTAAKFLELICLEILRRFSKIVIEKNLPNEMVASICLQLHLKEIPFWLPVYTRIYPIAFNSLSDLTWSDISLKISWHLCQPRCGRTGHCQQIENLKAQTLTQFRPRERKPNLKSSQSVGRNPFSPAKKSFNCDLRTWETTRATSSFCSKPLKQRLKRSLKLFRTAKTHDREKNNQPKFYIIE